MKQFIYLLMIVTCHSLRAMNKWLIAFDEDLQAITAETKFFSRKNEILELLEVLRESISLLDPQSAEDFSSIIQKYSELFELLYREKIDTNTYIIEVKQLFTNFVSRRPHLKNMLKEAPGEKQEQFLIIRERYDALVKKLKEAEENPLLWPSQKFYDQKQEIDRVFGTLQPLF